MEGGQKSFDVGGREGDVKLGPSVLSNFIQSSGKISPERQIFTENILNTMVTQRIIVYFYNATLHVFFYKADYPQCLSDVKKSRGSRLAIG